MSDRRANSCLPETDAAADLTVARAKLQAWLSPAFPVGAFAYSHGLETAVESGWIADRTCLQAWLTDLAEHGSLRNDLILLAAAWRAESSGDVATLRDVAELAGALQPSAERHLEATQQGASFILQIETAWPAPRAVDRGTWSARFPGMSPTYPVAVGHAAARHRLPLAETLNAYAVAFASNLLSAAIRLSVIGQTDAQRITAALLDTLLAAAAFATRSTIDVLGAASWQADIASMQHETQHTRLFRS